MIHIRRAKDRGHADHGWLNAYHTFSFADFYDPEQMGFRSLVVINEDRVKPGHGFPTHGHRDMEIITYVLEGALEHKDSMGNGSVLRPGEFQRMSAGTGVRHSEFNPSTTEPVHLYQIWLRPDRDGYEPGYEQRRIDPTETRGRLRLVASPDGGDGSFIIHQDARIFLTTLGEGQSVVHEMKPGRFAWLQVLRGGVTLNGNLLSTSDGAAVSEETRLELRSERGAEVMLFDLP